MPQQNECLSFCSNRFVSEIDYSEAQDILELTSTKQKQLRRQRSQTLYKQVLLRQTYIHVCKLLDSDCSYSSNQCSTAHLSQIDTNKRKLPSDDHDVKSVSKKSKSLMDKCYDIKNDDDVLQFLRELNATKVTPSSTNMNFSDDDQQDMAIIVYVL